ncbi:hypothetical protein L9F48_005290, partial [Klebsiella pneumoniae]
RITFDALSITMYSAVKNFIFPSAKISSTAFWDCHLVLLYLPFTPSFLMFSFRRKNPEQPSAPMSNNLIKVRFL